MAATVTLLGTQTFNTTSGTHTVVATPAVGDLIVIIRANTGNTTSTTPTDTASGSYTKITSALKATSADLMEVYVRNSLITSASSTTFSDAAGTTTGGGLAVLKVTGMSLTGSAAVRQSAIQSNQAVNTTPTPVFGSAPLTANPVIGAVFNGFSPASMSPRTSYTELFDVGYSTPTTGVEVMSRNSGETSTSIAWLSTSPGAFCSIAVELDISVPQPVIAQSAYSFFEDGTESGSTVIGSTASYYFNASDAATTDPNSAWTNDANAFDGNTATGATTVTIGSVSTNYLYGQGTDAPTTGNSIVQVRARMYGFAPDGGSGGSAAIYTDGLAELLGTVTGLSTSSAQYTAYITLSVPSGGWTWQKVNDLETKLYSGSTLNTTQINRVEVEVTSLPARDVTSDSNLALRIRLQESNAAAGATTDDYQLQYSQNSGTYTNVGTGAVVGFNSASLTDAGATTNRLGAGTGSFVAGQVSEDGLVDNHQLTASNYTEHLYSLTLVSSALTDTDTLDFRVLCNAAVLNSYTVTPRITVSKTSGGGGNGGQFFLFF